MGRQISMPNKEANLSISISFNNKLVYDALLMQRVAEVNLVLDSQDITVGPKNDGYNVPSGGGGISDETKIGDKRITFGHGGRKYNQCWNVLFC